MNALEEAELAGSVHYTERLSKSRMLSPGHGWQKGEKKNTDNCKTLCLSRKQSKPSIIK